MRKSEALKNYQLNKLDDNTVFIKNHNFNFSYTVADSILKEEFKGKYKYIGGLQCNFLPGTQEYVALEGWLCGIAEKILR